MSHKSPLQQRIVGGILAGLVEHVMDTVPELRVLDGAARRGSDVPPSRMGRHIKDMALEAADAFEEAIADAQEAVAKSVKKTAKKRGRKWAKEKVETPEEKPKRKAEDPDIIDLEKKPDGSYGAKS